MKRRMTREEGLAALQALSETEKQHFEEIKKYWAERRKVGASVTRAEVRAKVRCGSDVAVTVLRILEAIEGPDSPSADPEPQVPPVVTTMTADAKASFDRVEQTFSDAFKSALREERERMQREFDAERESSKITVRSLTERLADFEETADALASELTELKHAHENQNADLIRLQADRDGAMDQVKVVTAANEILNQEIATLRRENADMREMNAFLVQEHASTKEERDKYWLKTEETAKLVAQLNTQVAVLKEQRDSRAAELHKCESLLRGMRDDHAQELTQLREQYVHLLDEQRAMATTFRSDLTVPPSSHHPVHEGPATMP